MAEPTRTKKNVVFEEANCTRLVHGDCSERSTITRINDQFKTIMVSLGGILTINIFFFTRLYFCPMQLASLRQVLNAAHEFSADVEEKCDKPWLLPFSPMLQTV